MVKRAIGNFINHATGFFFLLHKYFMLDFTLDISHFLGQCVCVCVYALTREHFAVSSYLEDAITTLVLFLLSYKTVVTHSKGNDITNIYI